MAVNIGTIVGLICIIYTPFSIMLKLAPLSVTQLLAVLGISAGCVLWYEVKSLQEN